MIKALRAYGWPGSIRELENVIERALILSLGTTLVLQGSGRAASGRVRRRRSHQTYRSDPGGGRASPHQRHAGGDLLLLRGRRIPLEQWHLQRTEGSVKLLADQSCSARPLRARVQVRRCTGILRCAGGFRLLSRLEGVLASRRGRQGWDVSNLTQSGSC